MRLVIDATALDLYPVGKPGFTGGTELYVQKLAAGLAAKGHLIHVVCADLEAEDQRGPTLFYWPKSYHPTNADAVLMAHNLENLGPYSADLLVLLSNGLGADLGPGDEFATGLDAVACFTQCHADLLTQAHPRIRKEICHVTGLGVDLLDYDYGMLRDARMVDGRLLFANDPQRGLWHMVDIFAHVQRQIPDATLHLTYDWERVFERIKWAASHLTERLWECRAKIAENPGIVNRGQLSKDELIREQLECQVFAFPCDPVALGSQLHCLSALEAGAAGAALVLSDSEALPEVFGGAAEILPIPGWYDPRAERRWDAQDWAETIVDLMRDPEKWAEASRKARALAEQHTWDAMVERFDLMLTRLTGKLTAQLIEANQRQA